MNINFKLPELGENIKQGTISQIYVAVGDTLVKEQPVLELETDKAVIEVPSTIDGTIRDILVKEGDVISIGQNILLVDTSSEPIVPAPIPEKEPLLSDGDTSGKEQPAPGAPGQNSFGPLKTPDTRKETRTKAYIDDVGQQSPSNEIASGPTQRDGGPVHVETVPASPSIRRFAREIGVDIRAVRGSGHRGRISEEDVKAFARTHAPRKTDDNAPGSPVFSAQPNVPVPDFRRWGDVERNPMSTLRKSAALHLSVAWSTIPHVTHFDKADITAIDQFRKDNGEGVGQAGGKLTMTAILVKACAAALKKFPQFNASIDLAAEEIIRKQYINIGVAVDTSRGLLVPVIQHADKKSLTELARELTILAAKARDKKLRPEEMQGGNFSISNLGGIGGYAFTPIIHSPDIAILGVSRASIEPVFLDGAFVPRLILPLALSYDHRLIDGADAARFLRWICETLEQPLRMLLD